VSLDIPEGRRSELTIWTLSDTKLFKATFERVIHPGWSSATFYPCAFEVDIPGGTNYKVTITIEQTDEPVT